MTIRQLPGAPQGRPNVDLRSTVTPTAYARWNSGLRAAVSESEQDRSISILDVIGVDYWTGEGVTAKRIAGALRSLGAGDVTVNVNSPGGDVFEGLAIYNLLREHKGSVTVKVLGMAASAASVIAMAGDTIQVPRAGFLMIHDVWTIAIGNRHDMKAAADLLEPFDRALADIYSARTGTDAKAIGKMMDAETWIGGGDAIEQGFADEYLPSDQVERDAKANAHAVRRIEAALRASGMPKSEAMRLISEFKSGARDAAGDGERDATDPGRKPNARQVESLPRITFPA